MRKFDEYDLLLKGMSAGTQVFNYQLDDDFFRKMESADVFGGNVKVDLQIKHIGEIYELVFTLNGVIRIQCDRCLDEMEFLVDTDYAMSIRYGEEYFEGDDLVVLTESESIYNVAQVIYDTVMLSIPIKHTHPDGLCNEEMRQLLEQHSAGSNFTVEAHDEVAFDPRWEALKKLTDNN